VSTGLFGQDDEHSALVAVVLIDGLPAWHSNVAEPINGAELSLVTRLWPAGMYSGVEPVVISQLFEPFDHEYVVFAGTRQDENPQEEPVEAVAERTPLSHKN